MMVGVDAESDRLASRKVARVVVEKMIIEGFARDVNVDGQYVIEDGRP